MRNGTFLFILAILMSIVSVLALWTERNLEFYFTYFKGQEVDIPYWMALLVTIVLNGIIFVANVIGELLRLVM